MKSKTMLKIDIPRIARACTGVKTGLGALLASAVLANAAPVQWGETNYGGQNADGTHNWSVTFLNDFSGGSDYDFVEMVLGTTLAEGYDVDSDIGGWNLTDSSTDGTPYENNFILSAIHPFVYQSPGELHTLYFTTPEDIDKLGQTQSTFYTDGAGPFTITTTMPVPEPGILGLGLAGLASLAYKKFFGKKKEEDDGISHDRQT